MIIFRFERIFLLRVLIVAFCLSACLIPSYAKAEIRSREVLLDECSATTSDPRHVAKRVACYAYISGAVDTGDIKNLRGEGIKFCLPDGITPELLRDNVVQYMQDNENLAGTPGAFNVLMAMATKYPCRVTK